MANVDYKVPEPIEIIVTLDLHPNSETAADLIDELGDVTQDLTALYQISKL